MERKGKFPLFWIRQCCGGSFQMTKTLRKPSSNLSKLRNTLNFPSFLYFQKMCYLNAFEFYHKRNGLFTYIFSQSDSFTSHFYVTLEGIVLKSLDCVLPLLNERI